MINFGTNYKVHFIGIGGVSMSSLAIFCKSLGWTVSGSDAKESKNTKNCALNGIKIFITHKKSNISDYDFIIKTGAIRDDNVELEYAKSLGIKIYDRAEFLGEITKKFKTVIGISGTHGKSTTSAMIYEILKKAKMKVSCHIGALVKDAHMSFNDDILVLEACEYNKSFLNFKVDIGAVLNVEPDHLECYGSFFKLKTAFLKFLKSARFRYVLDNKSTKYIKLNNLTRINEAETDGKFVFEGEEYELKFCRGKHYINDALMAIKICSDLEVKPEIIKNTLAKFKPLPRRCQLLGKIKKCEIIIDYAHHPTEINCLIDSYKDCKSLYIFQPHTFSRTKLLKNEFIRVLKDVDCIIFKEFTARETIKDGMSAYDLYVELSSINKNCRYFDSEEELYKNISVENYDKIFFVGAGDINEVAKDFLHFQS